jgi:ATP-dependent DNA helicase RecQ
MLLERPTVVVSPLLALIADQEAKLQRFGVRVVRLDSTVRGARRTQALATVAASGPCVVLTTPETLESAPVQDALARSGIGLLAVDEAHCITEWGYDFRPAYLRIPRATLRHRPRSILALTATATPPVRDAIVRALGMTAPEVISLPPHRPNLVFSVEAYRGLQKVGRLGALVRALKRPAIVYCATIESVERIAAALGAVGVPTAKYHGRMTALEKTAAQKRFMRPGRRLVMVATSAFGMGIDKRDIRSIVHFHAPGSLEQYVQEAGRAGRDGKRARCVLLFDPADLAIQARLAATGRPKPEAIERLVFALVEWAAERRAVGPSVLALSAQVTTAAAKAVLAVLVDRGVVTRDGETYVLTASSDDVVALGTDLARRFETLRREDSRRLAAVRAYAESDECRSVGLRRYFGEADPPACHECDRCKGRRDRKKTSGGDRGTTSGRPFAG